MTEDRIREILEGFIAELTLLVSQLETEAVTTPEWDDGPFFAEVRGTLFGGRLTQRQVEGMKAKLKAFREAGWSVGWAAYALATSFHETAKRMVPVREGLNASDAWRKRNLRYYPYYGRGDVQLTWRVNYEKADKELDLGGRLVNDLDLALDPDISAKIMVRGMAEGWFTGRALDDYISNPEGTLKEFTAARRIINGNDRAALVAGYAVKFQDALKKAGY